MKLTIQQLRSLIKEVVEESGYSAEMRHINRHAKKFLGYFDKDSTYSEIADFINNEPSVPSTLKALVAEKIANDLQFM
jgi:hypothetical protein